MAIELCSDDSCPRISFSQDISQTDTVRVSSTDSSSPVSSLDFDFCGFHQSFDLESSSADELFFDGKILPIEMKRKIPPALPLSKAQKPQTKSHKLVNPNNTSFKNKILSSSSSSSSDEKQSSKSFWRFKRSNSLNCASSTSYARTLCPLPLLSRSNSTGSTSTAKHKQHSQKSSSSVSNGHYQKPPLRKHVTGNSYSNGIKINSVLNVPTANLFGLSYIFSSGKEKNKKR